MPETARVQVVKPNALDLASLKKCIVPNILPHMHYKWRVFNVIYNEGNEIV